MTAMSDEKEVARIDRGYGKFIIVKTTNWKENTYVDMREYYTDKDTDEIKPTKKGIRFSYELLDEVLEALNLVRQELGTLPED
jgi:hypothetical protein